MRNLILQLFLNKQQIVEEVESLQSKPNKEWNNDLITAKHKEWENYEHLIDLFFKAVNM